jgi:hypothetical protein
MFVGRLRPQSSAASGTRKMFSSAPQKRITRPWIRTTMSRFTWGMSKESCEPPW